MRSAGRLLALSLAVAAMLLRGVVPAGWMPEAGALGTMIMCPGQGPMGAMRPPHRGHMAPGHGSQVCPFAAVAHLAPPQFWSATAASVAVVPDASARRIIPFVRLDRPTGNHAPRGPPALA
ncbi:MAG TPA: DUF2946 family protein [Rhizomicrobium sp.]|nr:DUF2946 family protein [Rhizomicrobium sp.]